MTPVAERVKYRLEVHGLYLIAQSIALSYCVSMSDLLGRSRHKTVAAARIHLWKIIYDTTTMSSVELGRLFDRDHSTVIVAVRKRERQLAAMYASSSDASETIGSRST